MELTFKNPGFLYSLNSIMLFQEDGESNYWSDGLFYFYPELDKTFAQSLEQGKRREYIENVLAKIYQEKQELLEEKVALYQEHWEKYKSQVNEAFSEAFSTDCTRQFNDMVGNITLNPVGPRFLDSRSFDVFYLNSERGALGLSLHEMVHFVWFDVWQKHFKDDKEEYERPHLKWILSEMVVETIMRDSRLSSINPYFPRDWEKGQNGCVYDYFYTMRIDGQPILETLARMYQPGHMVDFMEESYGYVKMHEAEIRSHIEESEKKGL